MDNQETQFIDLVCYECHDHLGAGMSNYSFPTTHFYPDVTNLQAGDMKIQILCYKCFYKKFIEKSRGRI